MNNFCIVNAPKTAYIPNITPKPVNRQPRTYIGIAALLGKIEDNTKQQTFIKDMLNHNEWLLYHTELELSVLQASQDVGDNHQASMYRLQIKQRLIKKELERLNNTLLSIENSLVNLVSYYGQMYLFGGAK